MAFTVDMKAKIRNYFNFSSFELRDVIISIVVLAFVFSFKDWGYKAFDLGIGLRNLFNAGLIAALAILVHIASQRIAALYLGYSAEYRMCLYTLVIGLVLVIITRGYVFFLAPGGFILHIIAKHRVGYPKYGLSLEDQNIVAAAGPLSNIILAVIFKILLIYAPANFLIQKALSFNVLLAFATILPLPPLDGSRIIFGSRFAYAFIFTAITAAAILLSAPINVWLAILGSLLIAVIVWWVYYIIYERGAWGGYTEHPY